MNLQNALADFRLSEFTSPFTQRLTQSLAEPTAATKPKAFIANAVKENRAIDIPAVLNGHVQHALDTDFSRTTQSPYQQFGANDIVSNVLDRIGERLTRGKSSDTFPTQTHRVFSQADLGISKGIEEAKKSLAAMSLLNEDTGKLIDEVRQRLNAGLELLHSHLQATASSSTADAAIEPAVVHSSSQTYRVEDSQRIDFSLTTAEGDTVRLMVYRDQAIESAESMKHTANGLDLRFRYQASASSQTRLQIDGDLNTEELADISALLQDVDQLAEEFFHGDMDAAFGQALALRTGDSISNMDLNLSQHELIIDEQSTYSLRPTATAPLAAYLDKISDQVDAHQHAFDQSPSGLLNGLNTANLVTDLLQRFIRDDDRARQLSIPLDSALSLMKQSLGSDRLTAGAQPPRG